MALANHLVHWACDRHPEAAVRTMAFQRQEIEPTAPGDPQPNPPDNECHIYFRDEPFPDANAEAQRVAAWAIQYIGRYPLRTVAILCPTRAKGSTVVEALKAAPEEVPFDDLLRSTPRTREVARVLAAVCQYLRDPTSSSQLSRLYRALAQGGYLPASLTGERLRHQCTLVRSLRPDELLFPRGAAHLRESLPHAANVQQGDLMALERFAELAGRWVRALALPIDQLLLTLGQDLFKEESDLAICHTMATSLRATSQMHPEWRLRDFAEEIREVARNRRRLGGLSLADAGYTTKEGHIAITTMHRAKGLEWDAVVLMSVDSLEFPDTCADAFRDEPYFMPGRAPAVEARKCLEQLAEAEFATPPGRALVEQARLEYIAERLRLLYVGITRAKRDLVFSCSKTSGRRPVRPATPLLELRRFWQNSGQGDSPR
jgi:DNA helicase-2/ATP-dependent DNA helicase PcrA